ncbi:ABC transporter permease [Terrabacter sp. BE26]|uniref:ABC transporter permease n=1 Tax=Terrabacter sp. BE26 TaxID=2898152 RepID=UPI0035BE69C7
MSAITGTGPLLRLASRRDRVLVPASVLGLVAFTAGSAKATIDLYPSLAGALEIFAPLLRNPATLALYGPATSLTLDSFAVYKTILLGGVFLCLLAYIVVRRHTRTEEEAGRLELLGAGVVQRRAPLTAAVTLATLAVLATAVLSGASLAGLGLESRGSVAFAVSWVVMGLSWVGITAVAAQLTETTRGTAAISLGALGVAFLLRAVGDTAASDSPARFLLWLSPLGWGERVSPYGANDFRPLWLGLAAYALLVGAAFWLQERRDLGAGVLPARAGTARGSLGSVSSLTFRLARGTLIGWTVAAVVLGLVLGSIATNIESIDSSSATGDMLRALARAQGSNASLVDVFFASELHIVAYAVAALGISIVTRLHTEEVAMRAEALLATGATRTRWALSHLALAVVSTTAVMALAGLMAGIGATRGATGSSEVSVGGLVEAALVTAPAIWVAVAVAMLLVGVAPRLTGLAWAFLIVFLLLGELVPVLGLPDWMTNLSPFGHVPSLPVQSLTVLPLVLLTVVAAVVATAGVVALRRRDIG